MSQNHLRTSSMPYFYYCYLISHGISAIYRAYAHGDHYMVAFVFFLYSVFLLLELSFDAYQRLPPHQNSPKKSFLKIAIWVLTTVLFFGFLHQFAPYFGFAAAVSLYAFATAGSACIFYVYFIYDDKNDSSGCCSDEKIKSSQYYSLVKEASDKKFEHSESLLDRV